MPGRFQKITCTETPNCAGSLGLRARKAETIHAAHLTASSPRCHDDQWDDALDMECVRRRSPDIRRIQPMSLGQASHYTVPFSAPTCTKFDGQPEGLEPLVQRPARSIYRCGIPQRCLSLGQHMLEYERGVLQELLDGTIAFAQIALMASHGEVTDTVRATSALGADMVNFQWDSLGSAVSACPLPFG
jgi:hypothetical protein